MPELVLQASDDLVARLAHERDAVRAVVELIWNAIDAEANSITVSLERDMAEAISVVRVVEDGHGISSDEVEATFGRIGGSWKQHSQKTKNGLRQLHGKLGEGRPAADYTILAQGRRKRVTVNLVPRSQSMELTSPPVEPQVALLPPRLKVGDKVRFVSPARPPDRHDVLGASETLVSWGLQVEFGDNVFERYGYLAGTDEQRLADETTEHEEGACGSRLTFCWLTCLRSRSMKLGASTT